MTKTHLLVVLLSIVTLLSFTSCKKRYNSNFVQSSVKPAVLETMNYETIKRSAIGKSEGFTLLWIPFVRPTEGEARKNMLENLKEDGIIIKDKKIAFTNATADRGGFSLIGIIAAPNITLTADVIEIKEK